MGDILIILRSVSVQDKAISIGFLMTCIAFIPGKILYDVIANLTCLYWGTQKSSCRIHDGTKLGNYLCYMTGSLLVLCVILKLVVWCLSEDLKLYVQKEGEATSMTEMREMISSTNDATNQQGRSDNESEVLTHQSSSSMLQFFIEIFNFLVFFFIAKIIILNIVVKILFGNNY